jgi:pyrroloquinoline quinone (PQQ) biosynthesis protein C
MNMTVKSKVWSESLKSFDWAREKPYDPEELLDMFYKAIDVGFYGTNHPLALKLLAGELSKEQLQFMGIQEYWYFRCTVWWNAGKVLHCPYLEDQQELLGPLAEEAGVDGGAAHEKQFIKYLEGIGLDLETVKATGALPETISCVDEFFNINSHGRLIESLAANNLVAETMRPKQYPKLIEAFKKYYPWVPEESLEFFHTHSEADIDHAELGVKLFKKYARSIEAQRVAWTALIRSLSARWTFYDGIMKYMDDKNPPLLPIWDRFPFTYEY